MKDDTTIIEVDGLQVEVDRKSYEDNPDDLIESIRKNRAVLRWSKDADHDAADAILGSAQ